MAAVETYLRVVLESGADAIAIQNELSRIDGYVGSYTVNSKALGGNQKFIPFDIVIGFNGPQGDVDRAVGAVRDTAGVRDVLEVRNRNQVTQIALS